MRTDALRRTIHASTGLAVLLPFVAPGVLRTFVWSAAALGVAIDVWRLRDERFRRWLEARVPVYRNKETNRLSGASLLGLGYSIAVLLPAGPASAGILAGALGDPAAAAVGSRWGHPGKKTLAGSAACALVIAAATAVLGYGLWVVVIVATGGALLERFSGPLDDNLLIAPGVALIAAGLS